MSKEKVGTTGLLAESEPSPESKLVNCVIPLEIVVEAPLIEEAAAPTPAELEFLSTFEIFPELIK